MTAVPDTLLTGTPGPGQSPQRAPLPDVEPEPSSATSRFLVGLFVVAAIKGTPIAGGWQLTAWIRSLLINGFWGIGVGLILPLLLPRRMQYATG